MTANIKSKSIYKKKSLLILFVLIFAVGGAYLVISSMAASSVGTYFATVPSAASGKATGLPRDNAYCSSLITTNGWEPRNGTVATEQAIYNDSSHPSPWTTGNYPANNHFPVSATDVPWRNSGNTESGTAWLTKQAKVDGRYSTSTTTTFSGPIKNITLSVASNPFTTDQILRWASCKWGVDENILRAQTVQETDWQAYEPGDCRDNSTTAIAGQPWTTNTCQSYSILQIKDHSTANDFGYGGWPYTQVSTSLGADFYAMHLRSCFDGDPWVQQVTGWPAGKTMAQLIASNGENYAYWGCIGQWFSGSWYDRGATSYINSVKKWLANKTWLSYPTGSTAFDSIAPTISFTNLANGANISGIVNLEVVAEDNMGVSGVQYKLDGVNLGDEVKPTVGSTNFIYNWDTSLVAKGNHTISAVATDAKGNQTTSTTVTVNVNGGTTCSTKQGDANNDNSVNILDISAILSAYGQTSTTSCIDVTKDGSINIQDISLALSKYGT